MTAKADRLRGRLTINPDEPQPPRPSQPVPAPVVLTPEPAPAEPEPAPQAPKRARKPATRTTALEDPGIIPGRKDYRSFYLEDSVFARFRAAVYWTARHPDAAGEVPENMSSAVEDWMREVAGDLEQRFNHGEVFRMPPGTRRSKGKEG